jgi:hypothetical protein
MAQKRAKTSQHAGIFAAIRQRHQHRQHALERVEQQCGRSQPLAASAQNVGRPDIAGADAAQILRARKFGQHQPEGDRAQKIAEGERGEICC